MAGFRKKKIAKTIEHSVRSEYKSTRKDLSLGGLSVRQLLARVWKTSNQNSIFNRAAELAYYFLFALFPALIFISSMFGMIASTQVRARIEMMHYLQTVMPPSGYEIVHKTFLSVLHANNERTLIIGLVVSLWTAAYGMSSAQNVLNAIYRVEETRPFWKAKLIALLLTLMTFVVVFISMMLLILGEYVIKILKSQALFGESSLFGPGIDMGWKAAQICAALLLVALLFAMIYRWAPHREHARWQWITLGSTVGIAGWLAVSIGFRVYLRYFNHYAVTYGSFGAVIILLTWFYVTGLMLLLGAEINANIDRAKAENAPPVESKIEAA